MESLLESSEAIKDIQPENGSLFLRFFLGKINVKSYMESDRVKIKSELHQFRQRTNIVFLLIPVVWAISNYFLKHLFEYTDWLSTVTHVWLLYYYVSLSLRENILKAVRRIAFPRPMASSLQWYASNLQIPLFNFHVHVSLSPYPFRTSL